MSYQVLARKWRPANFEQVVGQEHVLQSLINALEQQRLHHAYLFSGTRGVGKTSIARLLAKALNCEQGVSATPCGTCSSCVEISQGNFVDLIEIDAASKTKVEDTRDILDNVQYKPTRGRYKVYLIDEVHMLSRSSFNALLKTLEEPPAHVKFLFATTETQKLPVTILSRCLQFNLKALSVDLINKQLAHILQHESVSCDSAALKMLANAADGSMRDALSLTDQAISYGDGVLTQENVQQMLGTLDPNFSLKILSLVIEQQTDAVFELLEEINQFAPDYDKLLKQISLDIHFASMAHVAKQSVRMGEQPEAIWSFASQCQPELLQLFYSIVLQGRKELPWAATPRSGFEMVILRLLTFLPAEKKNNLKPISAVKNKYTDLASNDTALAQSDNEKKELNVLEQQQESLLAQAKAIKSQSRTAADRPTASSEPPPHETATATPQEQREFTKPDEKPRAEEPKQPASQTQENTQAKTPPTPAFSEEEMLNMSMAMAHEDDDFIDRESFAMPAQIVPNPVDTGPVSGIDQFLKARNSLKAKARTGDSVAKKTAAVKVEQPSEPLLPNESTTVGSQDTAPSPTEDVDVEDVVGQVTKSDNVKQPEPNDPLASALVDDPATLLAPNTEDYWSNLIDSMALGGRIRQLGIHSSYQIEDNNVTLTLATGHRHLGVETAVQTLQKQLSLRLDKPIELAVKIGDSEHKTPFTIAQELHQLRLELAGQCIKQDPAISQFIEQFGAIVDEESIKYRTIKAIN